MGSRVRPFPLGPGSWPSRTSTTRSPRSARTAVRPRTTKPTSRCSPRPTARWTDGSSAFSLTRCWMRLLTQRLEIDRAPRASVVAGPLLLVAALTGLGVAVGLAGPALAGACDSGQRRARDRVARRLLLSCGSRLVPVHPAHPGTGRCRLAHPPREGRVVLSAGSPRAVPGRCRGDLSRRPHALHRVADARVSRCRPRRPSIPGCNCLRHRRKRRDGRMALPWSYLLSALAPMELLAGGRRIHRAVIGALSPRSRAAPDRRADGGRGVLHAAPGARKLRAPWMERQPAARLPRHGRLLCGVPCAARVILGALGLVALIAVGIRI